MNEELLKFYYFRVTEVWKLLCDLHNQLFNLTCDEYLCLLGSDIEGLDQKTAEKKEIIEEINSVEKLRSEIISELNLKFPDNKVENVSQLLNLMINTDLEKENKYLFKFNALLINLIERIQKQNKKNQLFLNKAISSLKEIREQVTGVKSFTTYNAKGNAKVNSLKSE